MDLRTIKLLDFVIAMTIATILSATVSILILFHASETQNYALKIEKANSTVEIFRWALETDIEEINYYGDLTERPSLKRLEQSYTTSLVALKFIQSENEDQESIWKSFSDEAQRLYSQVEESKGAPNKLLENIMQTSVFLEAYRDRSSIFIEGELNKSNSHQDQVGTVVLAIFALHVLLFFLSVRFDLRALRMERK